MSSSITDSQSNPNYYLLPSGFGCSCPEENSSRINSRDECLSAAQSLLLNGAAGALFEDTIENYTIPDDVMAAPKKWKFSPCGCFIWKNGRRIIYMDEHENDDVICTAVRWAQLVCKDARVSEDAERELSIVGSSFQGSGDHLAGVVNLTDVQSIGVGENIRKEECFDWEGFQPIYLWKNRNYCITVEDASHNSKEIFMKRCDSQVFDEHWFHYDRILYFHIQYRYQDDSTCLTGGRSNSLEPSLFLSNCTSTTGATTLAQQWTYDSNGRFRNRMNGKYLAVSGCDIFNDGRLVTKVLSDINAHCDFTQWLVSLNKG